MNGQDLVLSFSSGNLRRTLHETRGHRSLLAPVTFTGLLMLFVWPDFRALSHEFDWQDHFGPSYQALPQLGVPPPRLHAATSSNAVDRICYWNQVAIDASGLDHTPVAPGENRVFGEQFGPCRASRAMAIVQLAVFDAVNAFADRYESYTRLHPAPSGACMGAAIARAAHDTLVALYPSQAANFDRELDDDLERIIDPGGKPKGIQLGRQAAAAILALRADDGSQHAEPRVGIDFFPTDAPGFWQPDPISQSPLALGAFWNRVTPFVMTSASQFRIQPPPALDTSEFAAAYDEVKRLGGDGIITPTERTTNQTLAGIFWAYDGTPSLCAPTRLYNQIAVQIARQKSTGDVELARLLALVNVAMADAAIAVWESKYHFQYWRPVTAIRAIEDTNFTPLGAPASNLIGPNFTPPFPACPSGHAGFGGALFQTLRRFYGTDEIPFTFVSDELNGVTRDNQGNVRPLRPRSFATLSEAEGENGQSRIYLGIHWSFDKTLGIEQGRRVADYVFTHAFEPLPR